ncbi:unnamed protein product [Blepharisma stoltei]|uniref:Uncharacterized protein n=1 Tax=Blepharisma stoltei TaxID=1481888 RepID=A0AAU9J9P3_9CILI|nr:unnamed protein product [Blepharisma stoltei]
MGSNCSCAGREIKEKLSKEEQILQCTELLLGLSEVNAFHYDKDIARYALNRHLDDRLLRRAYESMGLDTKFLEDKESLIYKFYDSLVTNRLDGYDIKTLACLGILLGKGEIYKKAELLFKNYDRDCSNELDVNEGFVMFNDMMQITFGLIELAKFKYPKKQNMLTNYARKLKESRKNSWTYIQMLLFQGGLVEKLSIKEFIGAFEDQTVKQLCSAAGLRRILLEIEGIATKNNKDI